MKIQLERGKFILPEESWTYAPTNDEWGKMVKQNQATWITDPEKSMPDSMGEFGQWLLKGSPKTVLYVPLQAKTARLGGMMFALNEVNKEDQPMITMLINVYAQHVALTLLLLISNQEKQDQALELASSEAKYRQLFENESDGITVFDAETKQLEQMNPAALKMFGYQAEEIKNLKITDLSTALEESSKHIEDQKSSNQASFAVRFAKTKSGSLKPIEIKTGIFVSQGRKKIIASVRDVSERERNEAILEQEINERKKAEAELIQAAKFSSLGEMSSGIAHELNTPLAVVILSVQEVIERIEDGDDPEEIFAVLQRIKFQSNKAANIIKHLRLFGRDSTQDSKGSLNINIIVNNTLMLFSQQFSSEGIELKLELSQEENFVSCNMIEIEQVLSNILLNAKDAVSDISEKVIKISTFSIDAIVIIEVEDNGSGIAVDNLEKIFEPFFTTKDVGKGPGLGLSVSYGIISTHGGNLTAKSEIGKGATFTLSLPKTECCS